ncbi:MAG TPA: hypothetical protein VFF36_00785 [Planctomycetota bacterium]|nr:hypothetical protein [Planctomycetota bacterium]
MGRRTNRTERRQLSLKRETLRTLSQKSLGQVAGGTWWMTEDCHESEACSDSFETVGCYSTGSRYC